MLKFRFIIDTCGIPMSTTSDILWISTIRVIPVDLSLFGDLHVKQIAFHTYRFFYKEK